MKQVYNPFTDDIICYFRKSLISRISLLFLFIVYSIATFAPFLANDKPLILYTENRVVYQDLYWGWTDSIEILINRRESSPENNRRNALLNIRESIKWINIDKETSETIKRFINIIDEGINNKAEIEKTYREISSILDTKNVRYRKRLISPVLRSLNKTEVFFVLFYFFVCFWIIFFLKRLPLPKIFSLSIFLIVIILALAHPVPKFNPENYKTQYEELSESEWMIFPPVSFGYNENILKEQAEAPSRVHLLGTDTNGRDVLCRMIWGSRVSMTVGIVSVGIYSFIGIIVGLLAGFYKGKIDLILSRLIEIMICFPSFFLILTVMAYLNPSILNIMVVIGVTGWPGIARLMRAEALRISAMDYINAARAIGVKPFRILSHAVFINGMAPVLVSATFGMADAILIEAALSFLGIGVPQPTASWGDILNNARNNIQGLWWLTVFPGLVLFLTVTAYNTVGETLRDSLDPRLKS